MKEIKTTNNTPAMKTLFLILTGISLMLFNITAGVPLSGDNPSKAINGTDTIRISATPELLNLAKGWTAEYTRLNPTVPFKVVEASTLTSSDNSLFLAPVDNGISGNNWRMVVGHNAVVPVMNSSSPLVAIVAGKGITSASMIRLLTNKNITLDELVPGTPNTPVKILFHSDPAVVTTLAGFANVTGENLVGSGKESTEELLAAIATDKNTVAFCRFSDLVNSKGEFRDGVSILPVDRNGNGRMDSFEEIYSNPADFSHGLWAGKYPKTLCGAITFSSQVKPENAYAIDFLSWIMSSGSGLLAQNGFSSLYSSEKDANLAALSQTANQVSETKAPGLSTATIILLAILAVAGIAFIIIFRPFTGKATVENPGSKHVTPSFSKNIILSPAGLYFDKSHMWAFMERDGIVRLGVDDFLQHVTGNITRVIMKEPGEYVRRGEKIVTIVQDGKQLNLYSPVTGTIKSQNTDLYIDSTLVNSSPYTDGWLYLVEPGNWAREIQFMLMADRFREWITDEFSRLRDFFARTLRSYEPAYAQVILQDGGELTDNVLSGFGPEIWEEFQTNFINKSK
ncbi:MAG: hypothetical protein U0X39_03035 [Bacteroidales bacterium]